MSFAGSELYSRKNKSTDFFKTSQEKTSQVSQVRELGTRGSISVQPALRTRVFVVHGLGVK